MSLEHQLSTSYTGTAVIAGPEADRGSHVQTDSTKLVIA